MRILDDRIVDCDCCDSVLQYDESEVHIGAYGAGYVTCPKCKTELMVSDGINLTADNLRFPLHYDRSPANNTEMIDLMVKRMIEALDEDDPLAYVLGSGFFIMVQRQDFEGAYHVIVCTDAVYNTWVPFEED